MSKEDTYLTGAYFDPWRSKFCRIINHDGTVVTVKAEQGEQEHKRGEESAIDEDRLIHKYNSHEEFYSEFEEFWPVPEENIGEIITVIDMFCGAGGFTVGVVDTAKERGVGLELIGINHWDRAIESFGANFPWANVFLAGVEALDPRNLVDQSVDLLVAGPECTHFSSAAGSRPVNPQKRMSLWTVLEYIQKLAENNCPVEHFIIENVPELERWGAVVDGESKRDGKMFDIWLTGLNEYGYSVESEILNAADYGDPTSRKRLFVVGKLNGQPSFPEPSHSENGEEPGTQEWRSAEEIIDWEDPGESIWTRDLENNRVTPLSENTMERIAEGIRRHCDDFFAQFANTLEQITPDALRQLRETVVPSKYAHIAAQVLDDPFLVSHQEATVEEASTPSHAEEETHYLLGQQTNYAPREVTDSPMMTVTTGGKIAFCAAGSFLTKYYNNSSPLHVTSPVDTIKAKGNVFGFANAETYCLRQQSGGNPPNVSEDPLPTVATHGAIGHVTPKKSLIMPRNGYYRGIHSNALYEPDSQPMHTVTSQNTDGYLTMPTLIRYSHGGATIDPDQPLPTITTARGGVFAAAQPYLTPLYNGRSGQEPRTRSIGRPLMTVPASKSPAGVTSPFLIDYHGASTSSDVSGPVGAIETKERYALCIPELYPYRFDVKYRMLKPSELKQAQGFDPDYELKGTKTDRTEQIGNSVPVELSTALVTEILEDSAPTLGAFTEEPRSVTGD